MAIAQASFPIVGIFIIQKFKRKFVFITSNLGMGVSLLILSYGIHSQIHSVVIISIVLFFAFMSGMNGPVFFLYVSEILTPKIMSISMTVMGVGLILLSFLQPFIM